MNRREIRRKIFAEFPGLFYRKCKIEDIEEAAEKIKSWKELGKVNDDLVDISEDNEDFMTGVKRVLALTMIVFGSLLLLVLVSSFVTYKESSKVNEKAKTIVNFFEKAKPKKPNPGKVHVRKKEW